MKLSDKTFICANNMAYGVVLKQGRNYCKIRLSEAGKKYFETEKDEIFLRFPRESGTHYGWKY